MNKKSLKIFLVIVIFISLLGVGYIFLLKSFDNKKNNHPITEEEIEEKISNFSKEEKDILNISDDSSDDSETRTEEFEKFIKLSDSEKAKIEVVPDEFKEEKDDINTIKEKIDFKENDVLPEKFNLADILNIKVENQGGYGLCWAFASLKTLETHMQLHGEGVHNFSEIHLDYVLSEDMLSSWRKIHEGGNFQMFEDYLLYTGAVEEEPNEYHDYSKDEYSKFLDKKPSGYVTETVKFPALFKNQDVSDEEIKEYRDIVKSHIMKNGALYTVVFGEDLLWNNNNYYCKDCSFFNATHAITIVGWDDNYKKENFKDLRTGEQPQHDGAYIALNSWGEGFGDHGYFYISYDDALVDTDLRGIISTSLDHAYKVSEFTNSEIINKIKKLSYSFINNNGENYVSNLALNKITDLDIKDKFITEDDIKDILKLKKLVILRLLNTNLKDVSFITELNNLMILSLNDNLIEDVSVLNKLKNLGDVDLSNNKGVKGYDKLTNIHSLILANCDISDIDFINKLPSLGAINLSNNNISNIENFKLESNSLYNINLSNNNISKLPNLANYNIFSLDVENNNLETLNGIPLTLTYLNISGNKNIKDYSALNNISSEIFELMASDINITDPNVLVRKKYYSIDLSNNNITNIGLINDLDTMTINLSNNNIEDLSNYNNEVIKTLYLSKNKKLRNFNTLNLLDNLVLSDCDLTNLDEIRILDKIKSLDLSNNDIKDISNISKLTNLTTLSLAHNKNMTGKIDNSNLYSLNIEDCNIIDLDISNFKQLFYINLSNNNLFDYKKFFKNLKNNNDFLHLIFNDLKISKDTLDDIELNNNISIENVSIVYDFSDNDDYEIQLSDYLLLSDVLNDFNINIINGNLILKEKRIDVIDFNENLIVGPIYYYQKNKGIYLFNTKLIYIFKR